MLDTQQIMKTALHLAHFSGIPADSEIHVRGRRLRRLLVSIDVGVGELLLAQNLDCDGVMLTIPLAEKLRWKDTRCFCATSTR